MKRIKIRVDLLPEYFDKDYEVQYTFGERCPLKRACDRYFKRTDTFVGSKYNPYIRFGNIEAYIFNGDEWNGDICTNVAECYQQGDKTIYYVELEKL